MTRKLRHFVSILLFAASITPALAGGFTIDRAPVGGQLAPAENCGYDRARTVIKNNDMAFLADVPRTPAAYRFIVKWKGEVWGATVGTSDCHINPIRKPALQHPWCEYLPGIRLQCPMEMAQ